MQPKPWWMSKTIFVNALTLIVLLLGGIASYLSQPIDVTNWQTITLWVIGLLITVGNLLLRWLTEQPIKL